MPNLYLISAVRAHDFCSDIALYQWLACIFANYSTGQVSLAHVHCHVMVMVELHSHPCDTAGAEEWNPMIQAMIISCAGLVQYLIDAYPADLPHYDPL